MRLLEQGRGGKSPWVLQREAASRAQEPTGQGGGRGPRDWERAHGTGQEPTRGRRSPRKGTGAHGGAEVRSSQA